MIPFLRTDKLIYGTRGQIMSPWGGEGIYWEEKKGASCEVGSVPYLDLGGGYMLYTYAKIRQIILTILWTLL